MSFILIFGGQNVSALGPQFPEGAGSEAIFLGGTDAQSGYLEVSKLGAGNTLHAPQTAVNILFTTPGFKTVEIQDGRSCEAPAGRGVDYMETAANGSDTTTFQFYSNRSSGPPIARGSPNGNAGNCSNSDMTMSVTVGPADLVGFNGRQFYAVELRATVNPGMTGMVNAFKILSEAGGYTVVPETTGLNGADGYFAIQRRPGQGSGDRTFALYMAPDCSLTTFADKQPHAATFRFYDDDHGASFEVANPPSMKIESMPKTGGAWSPVTPAGNPNGLSAAGPGGWRTFTTANGGSGTFGDVTFQADIYTKYRILIQNVSGENGIRFALPFTEAGTIGGALGPGCDTPVGNIQCRAAVASPNPVNINQNSLFTVNVANNTATNLGAGYSLKQEYWSSINPAHQTLTRSMSPPDGPGSIPARTNRNFTFNISRAAPATFYFQFQMQLNGNPVGAACPLLTFIVENNPPRPDCYVRFVVGGVEQATNASMNITYGSSVTIRAQIRNGSTNTWGPNYFMAENINNTTGFQNIGNLGSPGVVPGAYTRIFERTFPFVGQTTWEYEVWLPGGPADHGGGRRVVCPITAHVIPDQPIINSSVANCRDMGARITWRSGDTARPITVVYGIGSTNRDGSVYYRESAPIAVNVNDNIYGSGFNTVIAPFNTFGDLPLHNSYYGFNIFAFDSAGQRVDLVRDGVMNAGPCLTMSCNTFAGLEVEPGDPITGGNFGSVRVTNNGYRASNPIPDNYELETRITGGAGAPPNSRFRMPINDGTAPVGTSSAQTINSGGGTVTAGLSLITIDMKVYYNGGVFLDCDNQDIMPATIPYLKAYGGDVIAGAKFSGSEALASPGGVRSYIRALTEHVAGGRSGSGGQLGVFSWGTDIRGFVSGAQRASNAEVTRGNYLTFARASGASTTVKDPRLGLQLTGTNPVLPNYFDDTVYRSGDPRRNTGAGNILNIGPLDTNEQTVYGSGSNITISPVANYSKRHTVYVDGNVYISGNIAYNESGYATIANIPNFTLVVRGNIYIGNLVTALSGTYIAQPRGADVNTGKIYTCATGAGAQVGASQLKALCARKLTVKGSLIASNIVFNRSNNTVRDSTFKEPRGSATIAEEITFSPDVYLSPPVFRSDGSASSGSYDSISTLPPIL